MRRTVTADLALDASGPARMVLAIAVARGDGSLTIDETLVVEQDGSQVEVQELTDEHGTRLHTADIDEGRVTVAYRAVVGGRAEATPAHPADPIRYLRPSRYCESDTLLPSAVELFGDLQGHELLAAVRNWVASHLAYVPGASGPTDGATATLLARAGVCRDFAHLVVALLRALDMPARVAAVYAPGLDPMDFHAVAEALVDGRWWVLDATGLAPRTSLLRISTGRDAADTAFLTTIGEPIELSAIEVTATVDELPRDPEGTRVTLG